MSTHTDKITAAKDIFEEMQTDFSPQITAARTHKDSSLDSDELQQKRDALEAAVRADYSASLTKFDQHLDEIFLLLEQRAGEIRPKVSWGNQRAVQKSEILWDRARMRLDSGIPLSTVIASADFGTIGALWDWLPAWIDVQIASAPDGDSGYENPNFGGLLWSLDLRTIELLKDDAAGVLVAAHDAHAVKAYYVPLFAHMWKQIEGEIEPDAVPPTAQAVAAEESARTTWPEPVVK